MSPDERYLVMESCMRPSGAYARQLGSFTTEAAARDAYRTAYFTGPGYGIVWRKTLELVRTALLPVRVWQVLAHRDIA